MTTIMACLNLEFQWPFVQAAGRLVRAGGRSRRVRSVPAGAAPPANGGWVREVSRAGVVNVGRGPVETRAPDVDRAYRGERRADPARGQRARR
jgi:hypothetical protein